MTIELDGSGWCEAWGVSDWETQGVVSQVGIGRISTLIEEDSRRLESCPGGTGGHHMSALNRVLIVVPAPMCFAFRWRASTCRACCCTG